MTSWSGQSVSWSGGWVSWLVGWSVGWVSGWVGELVGQLVGWWVGWLVGGMVGWWVGWLSVFYTDLPWCPRCCDIMVWSVSRLVRWVGGWVGWSVGWLVGGLISWWDGWLVGELVVSVLHWSLMMYMVLCSNSQVVSLIRTDCKVFVTPEVRSSNVESKLNLGVTGD